MAVAPSRPPMAVSRPPMAKPRLGGATSVAEPAGSEHPPARATARPRLGGAATVAEPLGAEDAVDLRRRGRRGARYGQVMPAEAPSAAPADALDGADDEYDDEVGAEGVLSAAGSDPFLSDSPGTTPLTIAEKYRLILPVSRLVSGAQGYAAVNADGEFNDPTHAAYQRTHHGLEWGFVLASQRSGALGRVLEACQRRDPTRFRETFGPASAELLGVTSAATPDERLRPVEGALLWQEPWVSRFRAAGEVSAFRAAQNEVAIEGSLDPHLPLARAIGFTSDRALAMLFDRCVQMGNGAGPRFVINAISPLPGVEGAALEALGFTSVQAFQESVGLRPTGRLDTYTSAAMIEALRRLGPAAPVPVAPLGEMLDRLVAAASGRRFAHRVAVLRGAPDLDDTERSLS